MGFDLLKFGFLSLNFRSRNAKKLIKGPNDLNYSLVSNKTLNQKFGSLGCTQGTTTSAKNA